KHRRALQQRDKNGGRHVDPAPPMKAEGKGKNWRMHGVMIRGSVAAASTSADAATAGRGFTGKVDMLGHGGVQRVAIRAHGVVRHHAALPGLHGLATGLHERGNGAEQDEYVSTVHVSSSSRCITSRRSCSTVLSP